MVLPVAEDDDPTAEEPVEVDAAAEDDEATADEAEAAEDMATETDDVGADIMLVTTLVTVLAGGGEAAALLVTGREVATVEDGELVVGVLGVVVTCAGAETGTEDDSVKLLQ